MKRSAMVWSGLGTLFVLAAGGFAGCGSFAAKECDNGNCDTTDGSAAGDGSTSEGGPIGDGSVTPMEGGNPVDAPAGCVLTKDPGESPPCIDEGVGVFVDAASSAGTPDGTRKAPYKTIGDAVASNKRPRVYVCAGSYAENVKLDSSHAVSLYGGFACGAWTYAASGNAVKVVPTSGYALNVDTVTSALVIADMGFDAPAGTADSVNSIAAFVNASTNVTLKRATLKGGAGYQGKDQVAGASGALQSSTPTANTLKGNDADPMTNNGGVAQSCTCSNGGTSKGGAGANAGFDGKDGTTAQAVPKPTANYIGAGQTLALCVAKDYSKSNGSDATDQTPAGPPLIAGKLEASGWAPAGGVDGADGAAGQGGGGGGGAGGGGGGGACGGCGGSKGLGGSGGGASVGLVTLSSSISLVSSVVGGSAAGRGGNGGAGGAAQAIIGAGGTRAGTACFGGDGGHGGAGGAGSGGAGGIGAGIMYKGTKPSYGTDTSVTSGTKGSGGAGGVPTMNDGPDGAGTDVYEVK
jgi:hypothetical protein